MEEERWRKVEESGKERRRAGCGWTSHPWSIYGDGNLGSKLEWDWESFATCSPSLGKWRITFVACSKENFGL